MLGTQLSLLTLLTKHAVHKGVIFIAYDAYCNAKLLWWEGLAALASKEVIPRQQVPAVIVPMNVALCNDVFVLAHGVA